MGMDFVIQKGLGFIDNGPGLRRRNEFRISVSFGSDKCWTIGSYV